MATLDSTHPGVFSLTADTLLALQQTQGFGGPTIRHLSERVVANQRCRKRVFARRMSRFPSPGPVSQRLVPPPPMRMGEQPPPTPPPTRMGAQRPLSRVVRRNDSYQPTTVSPLPLGEGVRGRGAEPRNQQRINSRKTGTHYLESKEPCVILPLPLAPSPVGRGDDDRPTPPVRMGAQRPLSRVVKRNDSYQPTTVSPLPLGEGVRGRGAEPRNQQRINNRKNRNALPRIERALRNSAPPGPLPGGEGGR